MSVDNFHDEWLKIYYRNLFPCELFVKWLVYGNSLVDLPKREFCFTLPGDVYVRYQSVDSAAELRKQLVKMTPHKIDIGAVYSTVVRQHRIVMPASFRPVWKELVFDIDLTDFDEVRYCCGSQAGNSTKIVCKRCWPLARAAVVCLDRALREDFGFEHLLWVYSGRRGVHCWVCDESARRLEPEARTAIAEYLSLIRPGDARKVSLSAGGSSVPLLKSSTGGEAERTGITPTFEIALHPSVEAACNLLGPRFVAYASTRTGQDLLGRRTRADRLLGQLLPAHLSQAIDELSNKWNYRECSAEESGVDVEMETEEVTLKRWNTLKAFLTKANLQNSVKLIALDYLYPRLDVNVTTGLNHLLKSPFSVHPKTGHICVPFDPRHVDDLSPDTAPTLSRLIDELNQTGEAAGTAATVTPSELIANGTTDGVPTTKPHLLAYKRTSLRPYVELFERFVDSVAQKSGGSGQRESVAVEVGGSAMRAVTAAAQV